MKQLLVNGLKFILVCIGIFLFILFAGNIISYAKTPLYYFSNSYLIKKGGAIYQSFAEWDKNQKKDIVILGSSHAYRGYDPRIFKSKGYNTYNLGTTAQTPALTEIILKNLTIPENISFVIYDIFPTIFCHNSLESANHLIANLPEAETALKICIKQQDIRCYNQLAQRIYSWNRVKAEKDSAYIGNGYCSISDSVKTQLEYKTENKDITRENLEAFERTLQYLKDNKIKSVFVCHPTPKVYDPKHHNFLMNQLKTLINRYGFELMDYAYHHDLDTKNHFYDHNHLNQAGVNIFNQILINDLKSKKQL